MGLFDFLRREKALTGSPEVIEAARGGQLTTYRRLGGTNQRVNAAWLQSQSASYAYMYQHQPAVRKVVDYIARNAAQLPLKLYERVSDTERRRDTDHPAIETLRRPNDLVPPDQFICDVVSHFLVHDNAYVMKFAAGGGRRTLVCVPPVAVAVNASRGLVVDSYRVYRSDGSYVDVDPAQMIHWRGYNPEDPRLGISRLETLRLLLSEDAASQTANVELLKSGLAKPGYIKRPLEAPVWSQEAKERFEDGFAGAVKASSRRAPVLEEGMEFADFGVTPRDAQMLDGRRFTSEEVASLYGMGSCPPADDDDRRHFYADVLAPLVEQLAELLNFSLLRAEYAADDHYFEFDLNEKLRGEPERRFAAITSAVGRPWLTANEARAMENRPPVDDGDELVTPLNVIVGDNPRPAPNVMPPQDPNDVPQDGSYRRRAELPQAKALLVPRQQAQRRRLDGYAERLGEVLERFYGRQERALASAEAGKAVPASRWEKWDAELAEDVERALGRIVDAEGDVTAQRLALASFDSRVTRNYLRAMAEGFAADANRTTREALAAGKVTEVFEHVKSVRAPAGASSLATTAAAFATREAAKQTPDAGRRTKTWVVTSSNSEHPELDGETVALGATFSNGTEGPPADHPGCQCMLDIR